jgi:bifunctional DNA-binding transcriptional regulator/antitoxin component of YhaV-PrlF toxin-antitoxin module
MNHPIHTRLGEDRRVTIPARLCARLGLTAGDPLVLQEDNGSLRLIPCGHVLRDVQSVFTLYRTEGKGEVDALIAERRAEAARDDRD